MRDDSIEGKITRVTFGCGTIKEGAEVTAYINALRADNATLLTRYTAMRRERDELATLVANYLEATAEPLQAS